MEKSETGSAELLADDLEVTTTVYEFADGRISRSIHGPLCLLEIVGTYTAPLGKELERLAVWQGDLGIVFGEIKVNPRTKRRFDGTMVALLSNISTRRNASGRSLSLCQPPSELVDALKLAGTEMRFDIISAEEVEDWAERTRGRSPKTPTETSPNSNLTDDAQAPTGEATTARRRIRRFNQSLKRTAKLEHGLDVAARYVERFLPRHAPKVSGYEFAHVYRTSEKVGGDFFDFIPLEGGRLGIVIGDVSGHGIDAALLMGISKKVLRIRATDDASRSPHEVLCTVSRDISDDFERSSFVTAVYGILDPPSGRFVYARAGHENPIVVSPRDGRVQTVASRGAPLGLDQVCDLPGLLEQAELNLAPGELLVLSTDGLPETRNDRGATFSRGRAAYALSKVPENANCQEALDVLADSLDEFSGDAPQEDDLTVLVVKRSVIGS